MYVESFFIPNYTTGQLVCSNPSLFYHLMIFKRKMHNFQNSLLMSVLWKQILNSQGRTCKLWECTKYSVIADAMAAQKTETPPEYWVKITEIPWISLSAHFSMSSWMKDTPRKRLLWLRTIKGWSIKPHNCLNLKYIFGRPKNMQIIQAHLIAHCTQISRGIILSANWNVHIYAENV